MTIKILDLFSGSGAWVKPYRNIDEFEIDSVDIIYKPHINFCMDVRKFKSNKMYDIIYASPPCTNFVSSQRKFIDEETYRLSFELADLSFSWASKARIGYIIENPYSSKMSSMYSGYHILDYCRYGYPAQKKTLIWSNLRLNYKRCNHKFHTYERVDNLCKQKREEVPYLLARYVKNIFMRVLHHKGNFKYF